MNELIRLFVDYLQETLGIAVRPEEWDDSRSLPVFMQGLYDCYTVRIRSEQCLLLVSRGEEETTPAAALKHHDLAKKKWPGPVIIVKQAIQSNNRQRLIEYKVPFAVPGNQLYLPDIGLDLREHFRKVREAVRPFSPSTQVVVLHALLNNNYGPMASTKLVSALPYTPMTVKRAFDEIEQAQIGLARKRGRERELRFEKTGHELWAAALPFLRNPVQRQITARFPSGAVASLEAGLTALSRYSMISAPTLPTLAISSEVWKVAKTNPDIREIANEDEDVHRLEIWRYDPSLLSEGHVVDRLSLFLSLRDSSDERVEIALDEMMKDLPW